MKKYLYVFLVAIISALSIQLSNAQAAEDTKAPVIEGIKVLTPNVAPGEKMKIEVKVSDDSAGLNYVRILFLSPSQKDNVFPIIYAGKEDPLTNTYILESEALTEKFEQGKWLLDLVQTKDNAQNIGNYNVHNTKILKNVSFNFGTAAPTEKKASDVNKDVAVFKAQKAKKNVALDGEFTFTFNTDVATSTFTKKNIYITDGNGVNIPLLFVVERDEKSKKSTITISPVDAFEKNSSYTLYIKDIHSKTGKNIKQYTKTPFTTTK